MTKLFYHFGGIIQLSSIFAVINRSTERILGGSFIDVTATALYDLGEKFPIMATSISGTVNQVLLPSTAHLHAKERKEHLRQVYVKSSRLINSLTGYPMGFLAAFAVPLITCWLGTKETFAVAASILAIFSPAYQMDVLTGPASAIYRSTENPSRELVYNVGRFFLVVAAISFLFWSFGASFTTINWGVASMMVLSSLIYICLANRFMLVSQLGYVKEVLLPGFIPYAIGFLLFWLSRGWYESVATDRWRILPYLITMLAIYSITAPLFLYFFILHEDEKKYLSQRFLNR
jgi:O-antigen/teichoic acid export membrane protein